jgi:hypothetical protein
LLWLFWRWRSLYLPGLASNLPISTSQVARITGTAQMLSRASLVAFNSQLPSTSVSDPAFCDYQINLLECV